MTVFGKLLSVAAVCAAVAVHASTTRVVDDLAAFDTSAANGWWTTSGRTGSYAVTVVTSDGSLAGPFEAASRASSSVALAPFEARSRCSDSSVPIQVRTDKLVFQLIIR